MFILHTNLLCFQFSNNYSRNHYYEVEPFGPCGEHYRCYQITMVEEGAGIDYEIVWFVCYEHFFVTSFAKLEQKNGTKVESKSVFFRAKKKMRVFEGKGQEQGNESACLGRYRLYTFCPVMCLISWYEPCHSKSFFCFKAGIKVVYDM